MAEKKIVCISCPIGCRLTVVSDEANTITVSGNLCERGAEYGKEEYSSPKRVVTAIVKTNSAVVPYVPVKTRGPIPRESIPALLAELRRMAVVVPASLGDVLIADYRGTGIDVVLTRSVSH